MQVVDPWAPVIFKDSYMGTDFKRVVERYKEIEKSIVGNGDVERDGGQSSVSYSRMTHDHPHLWPELEGFRNHLDSIINIALDGWSINGVPYRPTDSWINEHPKGAWTDEHNHKGADFVIVYYLNVPKDSGTLLVRDPLEYHWGNSQGRQIRGIDNIWYRVGTVQTGDIVMFPGWLLHKTEASVAEESRFVMSTNFSGIRSDTKRWEEMNRRWYGESRE